MLSQPSFSFRSRLAQLHLYGLLGTKEQCPGSVDCVRRTRILLPQRPGVCWGRQCRAAKTHLQRRQRWKVQAPCISAPHSLSRRRDSVSRAVRLRYPRPRPPMPRPAGPPRRPCPLPSPPRLARPSPPLLSLPAPLPHALPGAPRPGLLPSALSSPASPRDGSHAPAQLAAASARAHLCLWSCSQ